MKKIYSFLLASCLMMPAAFAQGVQTPPPPAPAPTIQLGEAKTFTLSNGLKVFVVENHKVPTVSISLLLDLPPITEGDKSGYTEMAGNLLRTGTKSRTKEQLDEEIDFIGADLVTYSSGVSASSLKKHLPKLFTLLSDIILNPAFKQEELDKLKTQAKSSLASAKANPNAVEGMIRNTLLFGKNHPYGEQASETTIDNIVLADVQSYYQNYFKPNAGYLAIVGDITPKEAKKLAKKYLGSWKKGSVPAATLPPVAPVTGTRVAIVDRPGAVQTVLSYANIADIKPGSDDAITTRVMNTILGGPYSRLMNNLREKHAYTYGASSQIQADKYIGQFNAFTSVRNTVTDSAVQQMVLELYKMRAGAPETTELQRAQNMVSGDFARSLENPETVALFAINTARYNLPKDFYANYLKKVAAVTPQAVLKASKKYITPENSYILAVGNADYIERRLARFDADTNLEYYDPAGNKVDRASLTLPEGITAQKVLDNYVAAIGGRANLEKIKDITVKSTITSPVTTIQLTHYQKGPDKIYQSLKQDANEVQRTIINGSKGKSVAANQNRTLSTGEVQDQKVKAGLLSVLNYNKMGIKTSLLGMERINGRAAIRVQMVMPNGKRHVHYFDSETGLKLREVEVEETSVGSATQTVDYGDYREVDGVKYPFRSQTYIGNQAIPTVVQSVEFNKNLKDETFKL